MKIITELDVNASASRAWQVLGEEFGDVAGWSATLASSSLNGTLEVGAVRTCMGTGFGPFPPGAVTEELTHFDREKRAFTYVGRDGIPSFVRHAENAWSVVDTGGNTCQVRSEATLEVAWWLRPVAFLMPWMMRSDMRKFTEELRHMIEHGTPHPRATDAKA